MKTLAILVCCAVIALSAADQSDKFTQLRNDQTIQPNIHPMYFWATRAGNGPNQNWILQDAGESNDEPCEDSVDNGHMPDDDDDSDDAQEYDDDSEDDNGYQADMRIKKVSNPESADDNIMRIEAEMTIDKETGEPTIIIPEESLENIPQGSLLALFEDTDSFGRAHRVVIRKTRKGYRRGNGNGNRRRVVKRRGNRRRPQNGNRRRPVRVIRKGGQRQRRPAFNF